MAKSLFLLAILTTLTPRTEAGHQLAGKYGDAIDFTKICTIFYENRVEGKRIWANSAGYHPFKETVLLGDLVPDGSGSKIKEIWEGLLTF